MNILHQRYIKQLINFMAIVGASAGTIAFSPTAFSRNNQFSITTTEITQTPDRTPAVRRPQSRLSELDRLYVMEAAQGGMTEIQMAKLALQRSRSNEVKQYAQQMIQEHTPVNQQLMQLANQKGVPLPTTLSPKYQAAIARLSQFSGRNFDQAYKEEAGINLHMEYLVVQRREAQLGQDSDLQAFANKNIPIALKHLQIGQSLSKQNSGF